ncbi:MAG: hypothetical protein ACM3ZE_24825 [Myxococcales bacterium]
MLSRRARHWFRLIGAILLATWSSWGAPANKETTTKPKAAAGDQLSEDAVLVRATGLYDTGQYAVCVDAFERLLSADEPRRLRSAAKIEVARVYRAACLIGVGRTTDAERVFREAILENPQMKAPDSLLFPEAVVEVFLRVRESMLDEIRRAELKRMQDAEARAVREQQLREQERQRVVQLIALAEMETVIERRSRMVASIPFGVGQFQNGSDGLGWFFLTTETAALGLLVGSVYMQAYYQTKEDDPRYTLDDLNSGTRTARTLQTASAYSLLGLGLFGIAQAHWAFVPELRMVRKRDLPGPLRQTPPKGLPRESGVSLNCIPFATPGAAGASLIGRF